MEANRITASYFLHYTYGGAIDITRTYPELTADERTDLDNQKLSIQELMRLKRFLIMGREYPEALDLATRNRRNPA